MTTTTNTIVNNAINWFEICTHNFERAVNFYQTVFAATFRQENLCDLPLAIFPYQHAQGVGGAIVDMRPIDNGNGSSVLVYLNAGGSLQAVLDRVESAGGKIRMPAIELPQNIGFIAQMIDSEGNLVGLHSPNP